MCLSMQLVDGHGVMVIGIFSVILLARSLDSFWSSCCTFYSDISILVIYMVGGNYSMRTYTYTLTRPTDQTKRSGQLRTYERTGQDKQAASMSGLRDGTP
jgi:hypothetical protein